MGNEQERMAFEKWFSGDNPKCRSIERSGESYKLMQAAYAWSVWQARAQAQGEFICTKCWLRINNKEEAKAEF